MAKNATYFLKNFRQGDYMFWSICSQCQSTATIVLKDDSRTYFTVNKTSPSTDLQKLAQDSAAYQGGNNLRIEIMVNFPNANIQQTINSYNITDSCANIVGHGYNFCIEDSDDNDYNDYYIDIVAWNKKG